MTKAGVMEGDFALYLRRAVPFHHLDPMGVVWHGRYLEYVDEARMELFSRAGLDLYEMYEATEGYAFPLIRTSTKHVAPLRLREQFEVYGRVLEARWKISLAFEIRRVPEGALCVRARSEQAAVRLPGWTLEYRVPEPVARALCPWLGK